MMEMVFKISYFSTETNEKCLKFAKTLAVAKKYVSNMAKCGKGKDFKITPIKLK